MSLSQESRRYNELTTFRLQMNTAHAPLNNTAVRRAFKVGEIDYAQLVKQYGQLETGVDASLAPPLPSSPTPMSSPSLRLVTTVPGRRRAKG